MSIHYKIDLNTCKIGQKLKNRFGATVQYTGTTGGNIHRIEIDHLESYVVFANGRGNSALTPDQNHFNDIVEILPLEPEVKEPTTNPIVDTMNIAIYTPASPSSPIGGVMKFQFRNGFVSISTVDVTTLMIFADNTIVTAKLFPGCLTVYNVKPDDIIKALKWAKENLNGPTKEELIAEMKEIDMDRTALARKIDLLDDRRNDLDKESSDLFFRYQDLEKALNAITIN